jgi:hypothetical protein
MTIKRPQGADSGSWPLVLELLERGDPALVAEIRRIHDPDLLGPFAAVWYADRRPASRRLLLDYLDQPLNAGRHEPLVKRLFKLAEAAEDDEVMGRFMVLFDRSVRRHMRRSYRYNRETKQYENIELATTPGGSEMPKSNPDYFENLSEWQKRRFEGLRLFTVTTRNYLRRRAWRYFRKLIRHSPERYLAAMRQVLPRYTEEDTKDGLALLDNWGLVHVLFHFSPALLSNPGGWTLTEGHTLANVKPEPYATAEVKVWKADAGPLLELLDNGRSKAVRQWAIQMLRKEHPDALPALPLEKVVAWLGHPSGEMVALAVDLLKKGGRLASVPVDRQLELLDRASPQTLDMLAELIAATLKPAQVTIRQAVHLAKQRQTALATLGFNLLKGKTPQTAEDCSALLELADTEAGKLRQEMVRWARGVLAGSPHFKTEWVLELLDSRHEEVREEGWAWLESDPRVSQDVHVWQRLLESPYDKVRLKLVEHLQAQRAPATAGAVVSAVLEPEMERYLWASVLLNVARGARTKPAVIEGIVTRLQSRPEEAEQLLPLLSVALRSLRGPEFRAGLVGVVQFARRHPEALPLVGRLFPELKLAGPVGAAAS